MHGKFMIDLAVGHPSTRLLATKEVAKATRTVYDSLTSGSEDFDPEDRHPLQYGTDAGPLSARKTFADWFTRMYKLPKAVDPNLLCITCGASSGLANTCLQMTDPEYTRRIFMITPAYFLAAKVFQDAGYQDKMFAIDEYEDGFNVTQLTRVLEHDEQSHSWPDQAVLNGKRYKYLFYAVPTFSNPSGIVWNLESRRALLRLARKYDILIITDEVYDFLDYKNDLDKTPPLARFVDLDLRTPSDDVQISMWGNTISNMSFSKYLGPGLRIGTIQCATKNLADQWSSGGANHSGNLQPLHFRMLANLLGGAMAQHTSYYIAEIVKNGSIDKVLERLRSIFALRATAMRHAVETNLPPGCKLHGQVGGYFMWLELPETISCGTAQILEIARSKYNVNALSGSACEVPGGDNYRDWGTRCIRLSLSKLEKDDAVEGIRLLGLAIRDAVDRP